MMPTTQHSQRILMLITVLLLLSTIACRATSRLTQRVNNSNTTINSETTTPVQDENVERETAVSTPLSAGVSEPAQAANNDPLGDELENLLDGLIRQNDQADDLEDFPTFEN